MRILLDTNIVLDVLLKRAPWVSEAQVIWKANDDGRIVGYLAASTLTDIFYVARRVTDVGMARQAIRTCLAAFEICTVDRQALELADTLEGNDFEDNLQIACARVAGLDAIVTRDPKGFKSASIPVLTPADVLSQI